MLNTFKPAGKTTTASSPVTIATASPPEQALPPLRLLLVGPPRRMGVPPDAGGSFERTIATASSPEQATYEPAGKIATASSPEQVTYELAHLHPFNPEAYPRTQEDDPA